MSKFSIVVAFDQNRGIGRNGQMPWHLAEDLKHFKQITSDVSDASKKNIVVMGRKTWESLPEKFRPLPERTNIVLTRTAQQFSDGVIVASNFEDVFDLIERSIPPYQRENVFVIGGQNIYEQAVNHPLCAKIYTTQIHDEFVCDTYFPEIPSAFKVSKDSDILVSDEGLEYSFVEYQR